MFGLGFGELVVIFLVVFLLFGPKALPEIAKSLAQFMKSFKKEVDGIKQGLDSEPKDRKNDK